VSPFAGLDILLDPTDSVTTNDSLFPELSFDPSTSSEPLFPPDLFGSWG
jgi:hypothetical protein